MTNEERARRWIEDTHLEQCVVDSEVRVLAGYFDVVRQEALEDAAELAQAEGCDSTADKIRKLAR
jgi:hypothetical protein